MDVDGDLARALSCMGTNDREVLIRQFQQVLGEHHNVSADSCAFFLDMNNWNLQAALGSYYDYGSTNGLVGMPPPEYAIKLPSMQFVQDITIGEGESVPPSTRFVKTWRFLNNGDQDWPDGCFISYMEGEQLTDTTRALVPSLPRGTQGNVSVEMTSPAVRGIYQSRWQLNTPTGLPFGESIWCIIVVDENGILDITQQLASAPLGGPQAPGRPSSGNPFASVHFDDAAMEDGVEQPVEQPQRPQIRMEPSAFDRPESPNGSCALYNAVLASLPQHQGVWVTPSSSAPVSISRTCEPPEGPPCTPCTPP